MVDVQSQNTLFLADPNATYNPTILSSLQSTTPSFPWKSYLDLRFPSPKFPGLITSNTTFIVETPKYFADLETVLKSVKKGSLEWMLRWRVVKGYSGFLGDHWREPGRRLR